MKIGLLFAGQGAQHTGMGKSLYDNNESAKKIMDLAGEEIKAQCFEGTKEMLRQTQVTQPCIYAVSMAAYEALLGEIAKLSQKEMNAIEMVGMAGFSLGEYSALTAGTSIKNVETGLKIVKERGKWMNDAGLDEAGENKGGMMAAFGERHKILEAVEACREDGILEGVNFNSPHQTVVAGDKASLDRFKSYVKVKAKEGEHLKVVPLSVSTAFHSPMMEPAVPQLEELLIESSLKRPNMKIYSNVTGRDIMEDYKGKEEEAGQFIAQIMGRQAKSPVYWQETIENMVNDGVQLFIEVGPGNTLSGLVKKINHDLLALHVENQETLEATIKSLRTLIGQEGRGEPLILE